MIVLTPACVELLMTAAVMRLQQLVGHAVTRSSTEAAMPLVHMLYICQKLMAYLCRGSMQEANDLDAGPPVALKAGLLCGLVTICCAELFTVPVRPTCVRRIKLVRAHSDLGQEQNADATH